MIPVKIGDISIGHGEPLALIAGPCVLETLDEALAIADFVKTEADKRGMPYIFKASYEKDNRGKPTGYAGPGLDKGLEMLAAIKRKIGVPVLSDIHRETDVKAAAEVLDIVQIPAYLCQQTSLVLEVGRYAKVVNVKKGQFLAPEDMQSAVSKLHHVGNEQILLTDRGASFGYHRLVFDPRSVPIMQGLGHPVVVDPTHMVRIYGRSSADPEGGEPEFAATLARAGVAAGANAIFIETHPSPFEAACDAASMVCMGDELPEVLDQIVAIARMLREKGIA
ncbi:MAG: 3-deoxy-8-phosphooctulonate synthase [Candidatus Lernaella stagnicola]|nr:3-deoxy-8-phosphooctulonate synthase [Candidatus Lernaella stagnicola]